MPNIEPVLKSTRRFRWLGNDWAITSALWLIRWVIILPLNWANSQLNHDTSAQVHLSGDPLVLFFLLVILDPIFETLIECSLPYWLIGLFKKPVFPPAFVIVSASVMAILHLVTPIAVLNALITGAFIATVYALAARRGQGQAILHAIAFHSAINFVGWLMFFMGSTGV